MSNFVVMRHNYRKYVAIDMLIAVIVIWWCIW